MKRLTSNLTSEMNETMKNRRLSQPELDILWETLRNNFDFPIVTSDRELKLAWFSEFKKGDYAVLPSQNDEQRRLSILKKWMVLSE